jgi:hypothetical protein
MNKIAISNYQTIENMSFKVQLRSVLYICPESILFTHQQIHIVHSPTNALFIKL